MVPNPVTPILPPKHFRTCLLAFTQPSLILLCSMTSSSWYGSSPSPQIHLWVTSYQPIPNALHPDWFQVPKGTSLFIPLCLHTYSSCRMECSWLSHHLSNYYFSFKLFFKNHQFGGNISRPSDPFPCSIPRVSATGFPLTIPAILFSSGPQLCLMQWN